MRHVVPAPRPRASSLLRLSVLGIVVLLAAGCDLLPHGLNLPAGDAPLAAEITIEVGESRDALTSRLGKPAERLEWVKQDEGIFGPIETFWADVPLGATVEIWRFPAEGGMIEAYFVDGSNLVQGTAFAPDDVVY